MPKIHEDSTERETMDRDADALERYQARRIAEIRAGAPLPERGFVSLERLRELADEGTGQGGPLGP